MKLVHKIGGGFLGLVLIIAFLGVFAWLTVTGLNVDIESIASVNLPGLLNTESAAFKVEKIQSEQLRYVNNPTDESASKIVASADGIIEFVKSSYESLTSNKGDVQEGIVDLYSRSQKSMEEFKVKFELLKNAVEKETKKKQEMMDTSDSLATMLNMFYKVKDSDQGVLLRMLDSITELKGKVNDYILLGSTIREGRAVNVVASAKVLDKKKEEIISQANRIIAKLDQSQSIKGLILKRFVTSFYDAVVGLAKGSGKTLTDPQKIAKSKKKYNEALKEMGTVIKRIAETPQESIKSNSEIVAVLKEESNLISEVRLSNLNYIITKNPAHKNIASIKLKRCIEKLDILSNLLESQADKMTVVDIMNIVYGYQDLVKEWQKVANEINTDYVPESTAKLTETSESFSKIVELVEQSTTSMMAGMVERGVKQSNLGIIISAISALVGLILAILITIGVRSGILQVLNIQGALVHEGDLNIQIDEKKLNRKDEVGQLFKVAQSVLEDYKKINSIAQRLASGQWQTDVEIKSEKDEMNQNLSLMIEQVNMALHQVANTVEQVAQGAEQVREASRSLSEGATSQAASLEEITSSMAELGSQTNLNADNAGQASKLSEEANQVAIDGKNKMNELATAMGEISKSAADTQKVVKTIDDIAFQTNLLALNAAVEAARAGAHGKGFAVVAEEVRNLAARSAKAAGETAELIDTVVKEINKGNSVATVTAEVLDSVAVGIRKATDLVGEIASASGEQAQGVRQINIGLEQIDAVTMQNTSNAEETASATEEMKNQANELQDLVSRFELKDVADDFEGYDYDDNEYQDEDDDDDGEVTQALGNSEQTPKLGWGGVSDYDKVEE